MTVTASYRVVGRYLMCEPFASGGMASVHLGRLLGGEGFSRTVAVKQLYAHFARDTEFVHMFLDEARLLSRIRHPHVVAPLDVLRLNSELFIIMEYVHGAALSRLLDAQRGAVSLPIASGIVQQTLLGLHAAHEATDETGTPLDIVHRDVSPQNILVDAHGSVRVVDFGIAKAASQARTTQEGHLKGKPGYLAPEQLRFEAADRRTDVFNAGIVLWELLSGEHLFSGDSPRGALERVSKGEIIAPSRNNPEVSPELDAVVARALCDNPSERFESAREMALALMAATSTAAPLQIGTWLEGLMGDELRARERAIAAMELLSPSDFTQVLAEPARAGSGAPQPRQRPASNRPNRSGPLGPLSVNAQHPPGLFEELRARVTQLVAAAREHAGSLVLSAALTIVILFAYDALFRRDAISSRPEPRREPAHAAPALLPAPPAASLRAAGTSSPPTSPAPPAEPSPAPSAPPTAAKTPQRAPVAAATPSPAPTARKPAEPREPSEPHVEQTTLRPDPSELLSLRAAPTPVAAPREPAAPAAATPKRPCRDSDRFTIDARGVKRWKKDRPECYTWPADSAAK